MDWAALGDETIDLLRRYLMIDTTNPPGNEIAGTRFLAEILAREGIANETIEAAPGRGDARHVLVREESAVLRLDSGESNRIHGSPLAAWSKILKLRGGRCVL